MNSVISKLEQSEYSASAAMARALVMRAELHFETGEKSKALDDGRKALEIGRASCREDRV